MLSENALSLLRACVTGENPHVNPSNLETYRELACAGVLYPVSGFVGGKEASFRFTESGWNRRHEILAQPAESL